MREVLPVHEPLLVNTLGYCAGTLIFAMFLMLLLRDRGGARLGDSKLTILAALVAMLWNVFSLLVIAFSDGPKGAPEFLVALSTSALSMLPAILLHLSLGPSFGLVRLAGYAVSVLAVGYHASEVVLDAPENHQIALRITTLGFGALTLLAGARLAVSGSEQRRLTSRVVGTMALFLFSLSFVHFGALEAQSLLVEVAAHHAGIPLALFVLLQDYRFLLLDAFVRFVANIVFAGVLVILLLTSVNWTAMLAWAAASPFRQGLLICLGAGLLLAFAWLRSLWSHLLARLLFPRPRVADALQRLRNAGANAESAAPVVAQFFEAPAHVVDECGLELHRPIVTLDLSPPDRERLESTGVEAVLPVRQADLRQRYILLGRRRGGRRYLSEDLDAMHRMQEEIAELAERNREGELRRLVSQAELRALQAQIHPHFLFNALNTLYGVIPREASGARNTVLNLADMLRYFLKSDRTFIPLREELQIIRAYLEIEGLRLGAKLRTHIDVPAEVLDAPIPVLTVEPLVENAVKHGVAAQTEGGMVRVTASVGENGLEIVVSDTGPGFEAVSEGGAGVGLENVTRRLQLCYGPDAELQIERRNGETHVQFVVPLSKPEVVAR